MESKASRDAISIYPNPAFGKVYVLSNEAVVRVYARDITGKELPIHLNSMEEIDISTLQTGMYFLTIELKQGGISTLPLQVK